MKNLEVKQIDVSVATKFCSELIGNSVFTKPSILSFISHKVDWWGCLSNGNLIASWPVCIDPSGNVYNPEFCYYIGPIFSNYIYNQPEHRKSSLLVKIYSSFTSKFEEFYNSIEFCLDPKLSDIRFFVWANHQVDDVRKYEISPRYTAYIDNLQKMSESEIQSNFRSVRRQSIKYASQKNFRVSTSERTNYTNSVMELYKKTIGRQGLICEKDTLRQIEKFILATQNKNLLCVHIHPEYSDELIFFGLILHDNITANLVLNCTHEDYRNTGVSSLGIYSTIIESRKIGCEIYDFNGANSPSRADDKHSYGARPQLYFHIKRIFK